MKKIVELSDLDCYTQKIKKYSTQCTKAFFNVAYCLWEVKEFEYFKDKYNNIFEYAESEFGYKKRTVYNFLNVIDRFALKDSNSSKPKMQLAEEYKNYNFSQLVEILSLRSSKNVKEIKSSMSTREVKTKVKELNTVLENQISADDFVDKVVDVKFQEVKEELHEEPNVSIVFDIDYFIKYIEDRKNEMGKLCNDKNITGDFKQQVQGKYDTFVELLSEINNWKRGQ